MVDDVVANVFAQLREMFPDMATEMFGQAVASPLSVNQWLCPTLVNKPSPWIISSPTLII